jgi:7-alpha-hydroxysteroid dehydrogenase
MLGLAHYFAKKVRVNTILIGTVLTEGYGEAGLDAKTQEALAHPDSLTGRAHPRTSPMPSCGWLLPPGRG